MTPLKAAKSDASLRNAAPDMYEALKAMCAAYEYRPPMHDWESKATAHNLADEALAKAEGK